MELRKLLSSPKYERLRPRDRAGMKARLGFLRSVRDDATKDGARNLKSPTRPSDLSILRRTGHCATCRGFRRSPDDLPGDPADRANHRHELGGTESSGLWRCLNSPLDKHAPRRAPEVAAPREQPSFRRTLRLAFVKEKLPGKPTWLLDEIVSLISGLSQRSSLSLSQSDRRSSTSSSKTDHPSSSRNGGSMRRVLSRSSREGALESPSVIATAGSESMEEYCYSESGPDGNRCLASTKALFQWCCSGKNHLSDADDCVHKRLAQAIDQVCKDPSQEVDFWATHREVNAVDGLGNNLLHVAARWGAPLSILHFLIEHSDDPSKTNKRFETFLHVFNPGPDIALTPTSVGVLTRHLAMHRFAFDTVDCYKRTCLSRLLLKPAFPFEALDEFFGQISPGQAEFLVTHRSLKGERLVHCICRKLHANNLEIPPDFSNETRLLRRFRPQRRQRPPSSETMPALSPDTGTDRSPESIATPDDGVSPAPARAKSHASWAESDLDSFMKHLEMGIFDPNEPDLWAGCTPLMSLLRGLGHERAIDAGVEALMHKLLKAGASVSHRDRAGNTALHYAAEFGQAAAVRILCLHGADVDARNDRQHRPLHLVKMGINGKDLLRRARALPGYYECGNILIESGATPLKTPRQEPVRPEAGGDDEAWGRDGLGLFSGGRQKWREVCGPGQNGESSAMGAKRNRPAIAEESAADFEDFVLA